MAASKLTSALLALLALSCSPRMEWRRFEMDGHRTGVTAVTGTDIHTYLGKVTDSCYVSPNGNRFIGGATPDAAALLLAVQPRMAPLKEVIGFSPRVMTKYRPESELTNWSADALMEGVRRETGRKVDVGIINCGGIRCDMPKGNVLLDDIKSMFPFRNYICYVKLKGSDLRAVFEQMAATRFEAVGGIRAEVENGALKTIKIGGEDLDDLREYGLATMDFLLDGGDGYKLARNASELIITKALMNEWVEKYVRELTAAGKPVEACKDGRVKIIK